MQQSDHVDKVPTNSGWERDMANKSYRRKSHQFNPHRSFKYAKQTFNKRFRKKSLIKDMYE